MERRVRLHSQLADEALYRGRLGPLQSNASWNVANWYIDPVNGNDQNSGYGPNVALKTCARLNQLWGPGAVLNPPAGTAAVNVFIMNNAPASDPLEFNVYLPPGIFLYIIGGNLGVSTVSSVANVPTAPTTGTAVPVSVWRTQNKGSNTPWALTTSLTASTLVGHLLYDSTVGAYMWGMKAESTNVLRVSEPVQYANAGATFNLNPASRLGSSIAGTDTFVDVSSSLIQVTPGVMSINGARATGARPELRMFFLFFTWDPAFLVIPTSAVILNTCRGVRSIELGPSYENYLVNCLWMGSPPGTASTPLFFEQQSGTTIMQAGGIYGGSMANFGGMLRFEFDTILQSMVGGVCVYHDGGAYAFCTVGIFDTIAGPPTLGGTSLNYPNPNNPDGDAIHLNPGSTAALYISTIDTATPTIWGSGNAGVGIYVSSGARFCYYTATVSSAAAISVTGTAGDFGIAQIETGTLQSYPVQANGTVGSLTNSSWANLANASDFPIGVAAVPGYDAWILPFATVAG